MRLYSCINCVENVCSFPLFFKRYFYPGPKTRGGAPQKITKVVGNQMVEVTVLDNDNTPAESSQGDFCKQSDSEESKRKENGSLQSTIFDQHQAVILENIVKGQRPCDTLENEKDNNFRHPEIENCHICEVYLPPKKGPPKLLHDPSTLFDRAPRKPTDEIPLADIISTLNKADALIDSRTKDYDEPSTEELQANLQQAIAVINSKRDLRKKVDALLESDTEKPKSHEGHEESSPEEKSCNPDNKTISRKRKGSPNEDDDMAALRSPSKKQFIGSKKLPEVAEVVTVG